MPTLKEESYLHDNIILKRQVSNLTQQNHLFEQETQELRQLLRIQQEEYQEKHLEQETKNIQAILQVIEKHKAIEAYLTQQVVQLNAVIEQNQLRQKIETLDGETQTDDLLAFRQDTYEPPAALVKQFLKDNANISPEKDPFESNHLKRLLGDQPLRVFEEPKAEVIKKTPKENTSPTYTTNLFKQLQALQQQHQLSPKTPKSRADRMPTGA